MKNKLITKELSVSVAVKNTGKHIQSLQKNEKEEIPTLLLIWTMISFVPFVTSPSFWDTQNELGSVIGVRDLWTPLPHLK